MRVFGSFGSRVLLDSYKTKNAYYWRNQYKLQGKQKKSYKKMYINQIIHRNSNKLENIELELWIRLSIVCFFKLNLKSRISYKKMYIIHEINRNYTD